MIYSANDETFTKAKEILANGGLVAFATETVYGLGANALNVEAVKKIFEVKNRPADNPIIVHLGTTDQISNFAIIENELQQKIIDKFMPGPLTILLKRKNIIPDIITAGSEFVGIRIPQNDVAKKLLSQCNFPVAAPSANLSSKPSPTSAHMVYDNVGEKVSMIIDGGNCEVGIESTVIKVDENKITITRPGFISLEDFKLAFGDEINIEHTTEISKITPGNMHKHYSPHAQVKIISNIDEVLFEENKSALLILTQEFIDANQDFLEANEGKFNLSIRGTHKNLISCAKNLFEIYHACDKLGIDQIYIESLPEQGIGYAIMNRVKRSAERNE